MIKIFLLTTVFFALALSAIQANDSCEIRFNKKIIFNGPVEQENAVAFINAKQFKRSDCITFIYHTENNNKGWKRTYYLVGTNPDHTKTFQDAKQDRPVSVNGTVLHQLTEKKEPFSIYTTSLPTDKAMAARIRVRRMFICKIEWN